MIRTTPLMVAILVALSLVGVACTSYAGGEAESKPTPTDVPIAAKLGVIEGPSYSQHIQPIFNEFCVGCHGADKAENGLRLDSYQNLMKGTSFGPVIVSGSADSSTLVIAVQNPPVKRVAMPKDAHRLSPNRISNIRYWIEAGAKNN